MDWKSQRKTAALTMHQSIDSFASCCYLVLAWAFLQLFTPFVAGKSQQLSCMFSFSLLATARTTLIVEVALELLSAANYYFHSSLRLDSEAWVYLARASARSTRSKCEAKWWGSCTSKFCPRRPLSNGKSSTGALSCAPAASSIKVPSCYYVTT